MARFLKMGIIFIDKINMNTQLYHKNITMLYIQTNMRDFGMITNERNIMK